MLKLTVALLTVVLAGTASAAGWRSLTIDGSSNASFAESVKAFNDKLPLARRYAFAWALQDIWIQGAKDAEAAQREYTASEYFRRVDGLGYSEVVTLLDPTGDTEQTRRREAQAWENRYAGNSASDSMRQELLRARTTEYRLPSSGVGSQKTERGGTYTDTY
jgi:hypothetical protein